MTDTRRKGGRSATDWAGIRERVEALGRTIDGEVRLSPEETAAVLETRARALAAPSRSGNASQAPEFLIFELSGETYAVESRVVIEVLRRAEVALLPGVEPPVLGIAAWRGELLILLDARRILGLPETPGPDGGWILVLGEAQPEFGIPVDSVQGLREIPASAVRPLADSAAPGAGHLAGITADAVLVLAAEQLIRTHS
jgi:purine-binding chemotaxis protein CheW